MLLAYFGPETVLPITSVVAAVAGFLMMAGRQTWTLTKFWARKVGGAIGLTPAPRAEPAGRSAGRRPATTATESTVGAGRG
jgi:hypothetical protein